jgi:hypothetical protein
MMKKIINTPIVSLNVPIRQHKKIRIGLIEKDIITAIPNCINRERCLISIKLRNQLNTNPGKTNTRGKSKNARLVLKISWIVKLEVNNENPL